MRLYKIYALIYRDFLVLRNMRWKIMEMFYFPLTTVIIWGFFSLFVKDMALEAGLVVLVVNILWSFAYLAQSSTNMNMNEDMWSGSLKQVLSTGITETEYLVARLISATLISLIIMALMLLLAFYGFSVALIAEQISMILTLTFITLLASIGLSIFVGFGIILLGREYGFLAWSAIQIFILLSAPFYSVSIFPEPVQVISGVMPYTYVFEGMRSLVSMGTVSSSILFNGMIVSVLYLLIPIPVYIYVFRRARKTGGLVRLT